jgi:hypothetical protein
MERIEMLKLASVAVAALLVLSPAYAKTSKKEVAVPPAEASQCLKPEKVLKDFSKKFPLSNRLEGDAFNVFKAHVAAIMPNNELPDELDAIFVFKVDDEKSFLVMFSKGCVAGATPLPNKLLAKLLDDGSL